MPLFAIAGSQGTGKSTVLQTLKERGYAVIERKTSRSVLTDWGLTLSQVNADLELTIKFQEEITMRKSYDEMSACLSDQITFTERTHADLYTYALFTLGKFNQRSEWLDRYYEICKGYCLSSYQHVFYLPFGQFSIEPDGVRACNMRYSRVVDHAMRDITVEMFQQAEDAVTFIDNKTVQARINTIEHKIAQYLG